MDDRGSSADIECIEINATQDTPKRLRKDNTTEIPQPHKENTSLCNKETPTVSKTLSRQKATRTTSPHSPSQRAISSRYVIDRTPTTISLPDANIIEKFNTAMNILQSILPTKNSRENMKLKFEQKRSGNQSH